MLLMFLGARKPFFLSLSCTEVIPSFDFIEVCCGRCLTRISCEITECLGGPAPDTDAYFRLPVCRDLKTSGMPSFAPPLFSVESVPIICLLSPCSIARRHPLRALLQRRHARL
jgi:hypothetical protein